MRQRFSIPKGLTGEGKVFKVGPFTLDKRQGLVLFASLALYWVLYKQFARLIALSTPEGLIAFSPLMAIAVVVAFVRWDGRHVDFWVQKALLFTMRPKVYLWKRGREISSPNQLTAQLAARALSPASAKASSFKKRPGHPNGHPEAGGAFHHQGHRTPSSKRSGPRSRRKSPRRAQKKALRARTEEKKAQDLRDSVQRILGIDGLYWEMLRTREGTYLAVIEVEPVALTLAGADDQLRVFASQANLYNRLNFPIVEITRTREGDVTDYADALRERIIEVVSQREPNLARFCRDYLRHLNKLVKLYNVYERKSYFVIPYTPPNPDTKSRHNEGPLNTLLARFGLRPTGRAAKRLQEEAKTAYSVLGGYFDVLADACASMNARARLLTGSELLEFMKGQTNGEDSYPRQRVFSPVTLEVGGYGDLSKKALRKRALAAESVRGKEPPALGLGDLAFADKVAPDAIKVHADFVRVGGRYHATLFCFDYGPDVGFGDLRPVLNVSGRVKIVKYVTPVEQETAIKRAGSAWAEVEAAAQTAANGDLIAENERDSARKHAYHVLDELQSGSQRLFEVSLLIHCEAESREEIYALVEKVKRKLAGQRVEAKLARYEALEGFKSCLPLGKNELEPRYARRNLLTNPLSCLFLHGTYSVDHRGGVLLGLDYYTGGFVVLNSRLLANPHMTIIGTSGGGKTVSVKALSTRLRMLGHRVVVIDPEGDSRYGPVAAAMDGQYVPLGLGSRQRINPCDIGHNYMNINIFAGAGDAMTEAEREDARRAALASALDGKCLMLTRLIDLMLAPEKAGRSAGAVGLTDGQHGVVDRAWHELYADFGITDDPATHTKTPPTMQDFFKKIKGPGYETLKDVSEKLYSWEEGSLRDIFSGHTNVDLSNKYLVLQIAGVKGRAKAALMYSLLDFLNGRLSDPSEPSDCFVDEFWSLLKYPLAAEFAEEMFRSGRARNNGMVAITQEIDEFLGSEAGRVIMKISASQLLLKQNKKTAEILDEFVELSEDQKDQLITFQKGEGCLIVQDNKVPIYVVVSEEEKRLFNTDPQKDEEYEEADRAARARAAREAAGPLGQLACDPRSTDPAEQAREILLSGDPVDSLLKAPPPRAPEHRKPEAEAATGSRSSPHNLERASLISLPHVAEGASPPIYAVVGPDAPLVAYNLAGLFARLAREAEGASHAAPRRVLFVDAEATLTREFLAPSGLRRPDTLLVPQVEEDLGDYVLEDEALRFCALAAPADGRLPAAPVIGALKEGHYACVVVACASGELDLYAEDWLLAASRVIAAGPPDPSGGIATILEAASDAEAKREKNGTLLASLGAPPHYAESPIPDGTPNRRKPLYQLPAKDDPSLSGVPAGTFAVLNPDVRDAFAALAGGLLDDEESAHATAHATPQSALVGGTQYPQSATDTEGEHHQ